MSFKNQPVYNFFSSTILAENYGFTSLIKKITIPNTSFLYKINITINSEEDITPDYCIFVKNMSLRGLEKIKEYWTSQSITLIVKPISNKYEDSVSTYMCLEYRVKKAYKDTKEVLLPNQYSLNFETIQLTRYRGTNTERPDNVETGYLYFNTYDRCSEMWDGYNWRKHYDREVNQKITGKTDERPTYPAIGFQYFDTTINKPIWWKGHSWVDATGTEV